MYLAGQLLLPYSWKQVLQLCPQRLGFLPAVPGLHPLQELFQW